MEAVADHVAYAGAVLADAAREDQRVHVPLQPHKVRPHVLAHPLHRRRASDDV